MPQQQPFLFDKGPPERAVDDRSLRPIASVIFPTGPTQEFDYLVPEGLRAQVEPGRRLRVPFGAGDRLRVGYCVGVQTRPVGQRRLKAIRELVDARNISRRPCCCSPVDRRLLPLPLGTGARGGCAGRGPRPGGDAAATLLALAPKAAEAIAAAVFPPKQAAVLKVSPPRASRCWRPT